MKHHAASKISAVIASAAAASQADISTAQAAPPVAGTTTFTVDGGISFANFSNTAFPAGAIPFIPQALDKVGSPPLASGDFDRRWGTGGYGSFSVARNIDALNDWRFSAGFNVFSPIQRSASASQDFSGFAFFATNTADVTERDRFGLYTADFDFGRNWSAGIFQVRSFGGLRVLYANDRFDAFEHTVGTDKVGFLTSTTVTDTLSRGRSTFFGVGPRVGIDFATGATIGIVGNFSAALLAGSRQSSFSTTISTVVDGGPPTPGATFFTNNEPSWVGNLSGSLGVSWQFSPGGQLVVGYKLDQWYNVRESFAFVGFDKKQDVLIQTPFIRATMRF